MKATIVAAAAAVLAGGASAAHHRHNHNLFANKRGTEICVPGCTTLYSTIYGEPTLVPAPPSPPTSTWVPPVALPTPVPEKCPTPGTYTFPATTITVSETTTVCAPETTKVPSGTHTYGGITTIVESSTVIVCPVATEVTTSGVVTSTVSMTTTVCPTPGTYTIAPLTTVVVEETVLVYPTVTTVTPGTYTRPAVTTTITETSVIVVCPFTSQTPALPTSAPAPPPAPAPAPATPPPPPVVESPSASIPPGGGMTYTPYTNDLAGDCKSAEEVDRDIKAIADKGFTRVRTYSTDCKTLEHVGAACRKHKVRMMVGLFVKGSCDVTSGEIVEQVEAIKAWAQWDMVDLVIVANEAIFGGKCDAGGLRNLILHVKQELSSAGYPGGYTTAETLNIWQMPEVQAALCDIIDIVGAQIHPYFNSDVAPADAGSFAKSQLDIAAGPSICGTKSAQNLECGWPNKGKKNGKAVAGIAEQAEAIKSIIAAIGDKTIFLSPENDPWKAPGECDCEDGWGMLQVV